MSIVNINWRPNGKDLRKFSLTVLVGLCAIGLVFQFWVGETDVAIWLYIAAGALGLPALTGTLIGLPGYWLWMGVAFVMGNIMSRVLLALIYYTMFTPIGLARRMLGADRLQLRRYRADSYWVDLESDDDSTRLERQF